MQFHIVHPNKFDTISTKDIIEVIFSSEPTTISVFSNFYQSLTEKDKTGFREQLKIFNSTLYQNEGEYYEQSNLVFQEAIQTGISEISHQKKIHEEKDRNQEKNNAEAMLTLL